MLALIVKILVQVLVYSAKSLPNMIGTSGSSIGCVVTIDKNLPVIVKI